MKKLLIFALTVFGLNTVTSQTNNDVQKNYLISDTSQVLSSAENQSSVSNINTGPVLNVNNTTENLENAGLQNTSPAIASQVKQKKRPLSKLFKNHSLFPEQLALKMPHM